MAIDHHRHHVSGRRRDVQCVAIVAQYGGAPNIVAYASSWDTLRPTRIIRHRPCHRRDGTAGTPEHIYRCYRFRRLSRPRQCQGSLPTTGRVEQLFLWPLGPQSRTLGPPSHRFSYSLSLFSISPGLTGHRHGPAGPVSQVTRPSSRGPAAGPPEHDDERRRSVALGRHRAPRHPPPQPQPLKPLAPASAGTRPARSVAHLPTARSPLVHLHRGVCAKLCESKRKEAVIQQSELGAWRKLRWEVNEGRRKREEGGRRE
jgi:hypothetical protein